MITDKRPFHHVTPCNGAHVVAAILLCSSSRSPYPERQGLPLTWSLPRAACRVPRYGSEGTGGRL